MRWEALPINTSFDRARRREVYRRMAGLVRRQPPEELPELDTLRERVRLFEQTYIGVQAIPVAKVVGTTGRAEDFDRDFLPRRPDVRERWMRLERAFPDGEFPPIVAYQVGDSYFVVDGHHRVGVARQRGVEYIDAEVTQLRARFDIPAGADVGKMILAEQRQLFMEESGLERACPEAFIELSQPHGYVELLELFKVHAYHMSLERTEVVPIEEAAGDFYDRVYLPTVDAIKSEGLHDAFPDSTEGDLFMRVYERRRSLFPQHGALEMTDVIRKEVSGSRRERSRSG